MFFVSLIDKTIKLTKLRSIAFKTKFHDFLIYKIKYLLIEDKNLIICIRINNALKYKVIEKILHDININIKFIITYNAYQNEISKKFNETITTIIKTMLMQFEMLLFF